MMARRFDLTVVMQSDRDRHAYNDLMIEAALFNSGRPTIVVPYIQKEGVSLGRVLTVSEKAEPSPMFPKGGMGKGTAKLVAGPGGMSLLESYHSSGVMGAFTGAGTTSA